MSKQIKQMEMDALKNTFKDVRDLVLLSISGLNGPTDNQLRLNLRKKNIRLQVVKNSLTRRVLNELGFNVDQPASYWEGPTALAWGGASLAELSRELENQINELVKKNAKLKDLVKFKGSFVDGQPITFEQAKSMPTRAEAIGRVIQLALGPASRLVRQILGPAATVAGQIKTLAEKKEDTAAAPS
ncbi:MAG TPA: 50S ribosomal protein L10 [Gemmataceae bacterium]|nr:50S ribosomal protein L10 [Gemmataceae bacterium]